MPQTHEDNLFADISSPLPPSCSGISIIVPVYNKVELTKQFMESFTRWLPSVPFEVIIVDNRSTDETRTFCDGFIAAHSWMKILPLEKNSGYGGACNAGARIARYSHLLFMNNDMLLFARWLEPLLAVFADERVGIAGGRLVYQNMTIQHAGIVFTEDRQPTHTLRGHQFSAADACVARQFAAVTGACLMIPKALFDEIGGFDCAYKMYYEDIDLCLSVVARGRLVVYVPECMLIHLEGKSSESVEKMCRLSIESLPVFLGKWGAFLSKMLRSDFSLLRHGLSYPPRDAGERENLSEQQALGETLARINHCIDHHLYLHASDLSIGNRILLERNGHDPAVQAMYKRLKQEEPRPPMENGSWQTARETVSSVSSSPPRSPTRDGRPLRILFQNRGNAFESPGGDTVVMKRLKEQLERRGVRVDFCGDPFPLNTRDYDLIHLFNLTTPSITDVFARNAVISGVPFVVTSLQEDFSRWYNKASHSLFWYREYVTGDEEMRSSMLTLAEELRRSVSIPLLTSPFAARAAGLLLACGESEAAVLKAHFPETRIDVVPFGSSVKDVAADASLFEQAFGVKDFVLCVGRLELRKNQLMLLHALERVDLPIVFADGGFVYNAEYAALCRIFRRSGKTIFTGRLSDEMLVSAYQACRLHALPSWYELPGLVSLEAALHGRPVVASSWGCLPDYLGGDAAYCEPDDPESVREAVMRVYENPQSVQAAEAASRFTWESFGELTVRAYERVLREHTSYDPELVAQARQGISAIDFNQLLNHIAHLIENGRRAEALRLYDERKRLFASLPPELVRIDELMNKIRASITSK